MSRPGQNGQHVLQVPEGRGAKRSRLDPRDPDGAAVVLPRAPGVLFRKGSHYGQLILQHLYEIVHVENICKVAGKSKTERTIER